MSLLTDYLDGLSDLVGGWNLASVAGDDPDTSGNGNNGVITLGSGTRGTTAIELGGTLAFTTGNNGRYSVTDNGDLLDVFAGGGTVFVLLHSVGTPTGNRGQLVGKGNGHWSLQFTGTALRFDANFSSADGLWICGGGELSNNNSFGVALVYDSDSDTNDPLIYLLKFASSTYAPVSNSELVAPSGTYVSDTGLNVGMGATVSNSLNFNGRLSVARIYSRALSQAEIEQAFDYALGDGDTTLLPGAASMSLTAFTPSVFMHTVLSPGPALIATARNQSVVFQQDYLHPGILNAALTGFTATVIIAAPPDYTPATGRGRYRPQARGEGTYG